MAGICRKNLLCSKFYEHFLKFSSDFYVGFINLLSLPVSVNKEMNYANIHQSDYVHQRFAELFINMSVSVLT